MIIQPTVGGILPHIGIGMIGGTLLHIGLGGTLLHIGIIGGIPLHIGIGMIGMIGEAIMDFLETCITKDLKAMVCVN